jgi:PadR family transcriptional regulator AphA
MARAARASAGDLLLGEWACLGIVAARPTHGFAVAAELKPEAPIGRVWSMSRALTYRCLDQLVARGYVEAIGEEPGVAGGKRTILGATGVGLAELHQWLTTPAAHVRDLRSELLLKVLVAERCGIDVTAMLAAQQAIVAELTEALVARAAPGDVVDLWRVETSRAALRFLGALSPGRGAARRGPRGRRG